MNQRILFVDDVADWRAMLSGLLTDQGYSVESAESAADAMRILGKTTFDIAIIDMRLDETDERNIEGLTLVKSIKQKHPDMPVIILTGYGTLDTVAMAMKPDPKTRQRLVDRFVDKVNIAALPENLRSVITPGVSSVAPL